MTADDASLVALVSEGDEVAFERLVSKYEQRLIRYLRSFVRDEEKARELVQDTFVKVYRNAHRYEPKATFATWLFRIAHNTAISYLRKKKVALVFGFGNYDAETDQPTGDVASEAPGPDRLAEDGEIARLVRQELAGLPEKLREAFVLFDIEELSITEVARVTGSPEGTVKARIFRARRALRERLRGYHLAGEAPTELAPAAPARRRRKGL